MSESRIEKILDDAANLGKKYEWLGAADLYGQAMSAVDEKDYLRRGEIQEKIGYSLRRAAFQTESQEEFRERMHGAIEAYGKAHGFYGELADERGAPWMHHCRAISQNLRHWLTSDPSEKRRLLNGSLELEEKALTTFWDLGNKQEYGRTYNDLPLAVWHLYHYEWDREVRRRILVKVLQWGEKGVAVHTDPLEIARANYTLALHSSCKIYSFVEDIEKQEQHRLKIHKLLHKAIELSESVKDAYIVGLSLIRLSIGGGAKSIRNLEKALDCGEETRDIYLKGLALDFLAFATHWRAFGTDDPDKREILAEEAMGYYDKAQHYFSVMSYLNPRIGLLLAPGGYTEYYYNRSRWETEQEKKRDLLKKSEKVGLDALKAAEDLDIPHVIDRMCHYLSKTLQAQASLESDIDVKRSLLERTMKYRKRNIDIDERVEPFHYWNIGTWYNYLALIQAELADIELDHAGKRKLLEDAAFSMEKGLSGIIAQIPYYEKIGGSHYSAALSRWLGHYEVILTSIYEVTNEPEYLRKAIEISRKAIKSARKAGMLSWIAESYWKIAKTYDLLGEHINAADNFMRASESYVKAAEKIPQLQGFYQDHAKYMRAWNEIERAKYNHKEKKYGIAKEHYKKVAELHENTERWNYLSPNYLAWARLEEAEDLSRSEQTLEARDIFQQAANLFVKTEESINAKLITIDARDERKIAEGLVKASDVRREYCLGRIAMEEARILDRQGDHTTSSERYGFAAEKFQTVIEAQKQESERRELQPIVYLSQAWQKMMNAEARASPTLYGEAAVLFIRAKDHALDQTTSFLAQAHSSFCRALEAGARFELNRDPTLFSTAKNHIEAATSYYLRAGYRTASDYARATSRLIDAYMYSYNAQIETDPEKKARFYQMAERLLQASASSYVRARHPEKNEEVQRLLESINEEKEIAMSLMEALHAPAMTSTTTSFSTPTPTHEQAVGLERFKYADIQANLILREREVKVGEDLDLEIALVNAGKAPAQLIKVDDIIPEGFEVKGVPDICRLEDGHLDMKGRTLNPLKTEELRLVLRPLNMGTFHLRPRILYLDESGKYKSYEPESNIVKVRRRRGPPI